MRYPRALVMAGVASLAIIAAAPAASSSPPPPVARASSGDVVAFYYAWYGNPAFDGEWVHWNDPRLGIRPPGDISSDYYPKLGAYSSRDPAVLRQHMRWLRQARVGVIALSWWDGETSDADVRRILDAALAAGIKVAFHIEPVTGRTAATYQANVIRLVRQFRSHPGLYTTTRESPYLSGGKPRPLVFVWATGLRDFDHPEGVTPDYWARANDAIHRSVGALVVACPCGGGYAQAVTEGHFDGAYNYATLDLADQGGFGWARGMPAKSLYIPSVIPGFHADRVGYETSTRVPRREGATYDEQWQAALGTGVVPDLVSITSFNEWHEGSQIEPTRASYSAGDRDYLDFSPQSPTFYLGRTAQWVAKYVAGDYPKVRSTPARIRVTTTSDWVTLEVANGSLVRPGPISASREATRADFTGETIGMNQPVSRADAGQAVTMTFEVLVLGDAITLVGDGGLLGSTTLVLERRSPEGWAEIGRTTWVGGADAGQQRTMTLQ